jgi:mevalonate kinase
MLLGEHAVLHGREALVTAVNRRVEVTLRTRDDGDVVIDSALGHYRGSLSHLQIEPPFRFILAALSEQSSSVPDGVDIAVRSEFSDKVGLASSAAVTVATHAALARHATGKSPDPETVFERTLATIRSVQGMGSGADVAAAVWGGTVAYRAEPRSIRRLDSLCPLTVLYSGGKIPTPEVVRRVEEARRARPEAFEKIFDDMERAVEEACRALAEEDWSALGAVLDRGQSLMVELGVSNAALEDLIAQLRADPAIYGAKISGAGLGDCVVGLGRLSETRPMDIVDVSSASEGMRCD